MKHYELDLIVTKVYKVEVFAYDEDDILNQVEKELDYYTQESRLASIQLDTESVRHYEDERYEKEREYRYA